MCLWKWQKLVLHSRSYITKHTSNYDLNIFHVANEEDVVKLDVFLYSTFLSLWILYYIASHEQPKNINRKLSLVEFHVKRLTLYFVFYENWLIFLVISYRMRCDLPIPILHHGFFVLEQETHFPLQLIADFLCQLLWRCDDVDEVLLQLRHATQ